MNSAARRIRRYVGRTLLGIETSEQRTSPNALFDGATAGFMSSFGDANPHVGFYVVWRQPGPGFFSILSSTLCHLQLAERLNLVPVVDMEHFPSQYNEAHEVDGTMNSWDYYFEPVSSYTVDEVYESKTVYLCDGEYPPGYSVWITEVPDLDAVYNKYVRVKPAIAQEINDFVDSHFSGTSVLGVHFRGQDMRTTPFHQLPPTPKQMINWTTLLIEEGGYEKVFLATEEEAYLELFRSAFGSRVICTEAYRTRGVNAYEIYPREDHNYLRGLEVLRDALVLSRCNALLGSGSNVAEVAQFMNGGQYERVVRISNGPNSGIPIIARYQWSVRKNLPPCVGGFPDM